MSTGRHPFARAAAALTAAVALATGSAFGTGAAAANSSSSSGSADARDNFTLTILHNNDGESALLPIERTGADGSTAEYAGADRFVSLVHQQRREALTSRPRPAGKRGVIVLSGGDNFLPGAQLNASLEPGAPLYDADVFSAVRYDASAIGNHDFDLGPDFLAEFIEEVRPDVPFVSANLDFSGEPNLQALVDDGTIVESTVVRERGERIGVIGLTTPLLPKLTSLGDVTVDPALADVTNAQVRALEAAGVNKIIVVSHLQDIDNELALVSELRGVDVVVGAGGGEVMADPQDVLIPEDSVSLDESGQPLGYPELRTDAEGNEVPVVTTSGLFRYLGQLVVTFDSHGEIVAIDDERSAPLRVSSVGPDAVKPDSRVERRVVEEVEEYLETLDETVVAISEVPLDGTRTNVRSMETNLGNLVADSQLAAGQELAGDVGVAPPLVSFQNGGGIRNDAVIPAGEITALDTFSIVPFSNFVAIAPELPIETFVDVVEFASVSEGGQFAQIGGFEYVYDADAELGERVVSITLEDGTPVVVDGEIVYGPDTISVATIDFLLRGGDGYPFGDVDFTVLPVTYQQALLDYLTGPLGGRITAADYPEGGEGRITAV